MVNKYHYETHAGKNVFFVLHNYEALIQGTLAGSGKKYPNQWLNLELRIQLKKKAGSGFQNVES